LRRAAVAFRTTLALVLLLFGGLAAAQQPDQPGIQDNSFLVEEAYNQEEGVVQHIQTFQRGDDGDWVATFTQEWPVPRQTHQLSYTLSAARRAGGAGTGLGDLLLNYRYQLLGDSKARVAVAPRLSVLLPTGSYKAERGAGGAGLQTLWPISVVLSPYLVAHGNVGATWIPSARDSRGARARTLSYNFGTSVIWLASPRVNLLTEAVWSRNEVVEGPDRTRHEDDFFINPGARVAFNFRDGLQIVPGFSAPLGVGPSRGRWSIFLYLSFEHPLWGARSPRPQKAPKRLPL